jgi:hypothetical protein
MEERIDMSCPMALQFLELLKPGREPHFAKRAWVIVVNLIGKGEGNEEGHIALGHETDERNHTLNGSDWINFNLYPF